MNTIHDPNAVESRERVASLWRKLNYTPLRDVLRGRLTARLDWRGLIHAAALPSVAGDRVHEVVRRLRLTRLERSAVARELIAHFRDGLDSGIAVETLVEQFGDARQLAPLITRAQKRMRSALRRALGMAVKLNLLLLAAAVLLYTLLWVRMAWRQPGLETNYWNQLEAEVAMIPPEQRAWPRYRSAFLQLRSTPPDLALNSILQASTDPNVLQWAREHQDVLELIAEGAAALQLGVTLQRSPDRDLRLKWLELGNESAEARRTELENLDARPKEDNPELVGGILEYAAVVRRLAYGLRAASADAVARDDGAAFVALVEQRLQIARHAAEPDVVISTLVGLAIAQAVYTDVMELLSERPALLSEPQWVRTAHLLAAVDRKLLTLDLRWERMSFLDIVQRVYTSGPYGRPAGADLYFALDEGTDVAEIFPGREWSWPVMAALEPDRGAVEAAYDDYLADLQAYGALPLWRRDEHDVAADYETQVSASDSTLMREYTPRLARAFDLVEYAVQFRDATLTAVALELHQRRTGVWPSTLTELSPTLLPSPPVDRLTGDPLRYRVVDGRPLLYSVGADRDDDGGRLVNPRTSVHSTTWVQPVTEPQRTATGEYHAPDGDWVLFPPPTTGEPDDA